MAEDIQPPTMQAQPPKPAPIRCTNCTYNDVNAGPSCPHCGISREAAKKRVQDEIVRVAAAAEKQRLSERQTLAEGQRSGDGQKPAEDIHDEKASDTAETPPLSDREPVLSA